MLAELGAPIPSASATSTGGEGADEAPDVATTVPDVSSPVPRSFRSDATPLGGIDFPGVSPTLIFDDGSPATPDSDLISHMTSEPTNGGNSLADQYPEVAREWDSDSNDPLTAKMITPVRFPRKRGGRVRQINGVSGIFG